MCILSGQSIPVLRGSYDLFNFRAAVRPEAALEEIPDELGDEVDGLLHLHGEGVAVEPAGLNKKQENSFSFPRQKSRSPCISWSNFAPTPLIYQFLLIFKQQFSEVTKKTLEKTKKCAKNDHFYLILP